jgi:hypothetical protein
VRFAVSFPPLQGRVAESVTDWVAHLPLSVDGPRPWARFPTDLTLQSWRAWRGLAGTLHEAHPSSDTDFRRLVLSREL